MKMNLKDTALYLVILVLIGFLFWALFKLYKNQAYNIKKDYYDEIFQYTETIEQKNVLIDEIAVAALKVDSLRSSYQKELIFAKQEIEALNIKLKRAKSFTYFNHTAIDTFIIRLTDTLFIEDSGKFGFYSDGYFSGEFFYSPLTDSLKLNYSISDTIMVIDSWIRKPNRRGEQAFILWRWLRPWQVKCDIKSKNPNSIIKNGKRLFINKK